MGTDLFNMSMEELLDVDVETASRSLTSIKKLPVTIRVVSRQEILNNTYKSIVDVLKDQPGIRVAQPGSGVKGDLFYMRGFNGNIYAKILINGLPAQSIAYYLPLSEQIPLHNIERIEIMYGPASAIFGADSLSGVINIITLMPEEHKSIGEVTIGQKGYRHVNFFGGGSVGEGKDKAKFSIYALYSKRDDLDVKDMYPSVYESEVYFSGWKDNENPVIGKMPSKDYSFGFNTFYRDFKLTYDYMYRADHSSTGMETAHYFYNDPSAIMAETIQKVSLMHKVQLSESFSLKSNLSYLRFRRDNQSFYNFIYVDSKKAYKYSASDEIFLEEIAIFDVSESIEIVGGLNLQYTGVLPKTNDLETPFDPSDYKAFSYKVDESAYHPIMGDFGLNPLM